MRTWNQHIVVAALLAACGGGDSKNDPDAAANPDGGSADATVDAEPPLIGIDALCAPGGAYDQLFDKMNECLNPSFVFVNILSDGLLDGMPLERICRGEFDPLVDDGSITIDDDKLQGCIDYIAATDCRELSLEQLRTTPCGQVIVGTIAEGGDCEESQQCEGDRYCAPGDGCGTCTDRLVDGIDCLEDDQCQSGTCSSAGICGAAKGLDEACDGDEDCVDTLACAPDNTCRPLLAQSGDTCLDQGDCTFPFSGLYCKLPPAVFGIVANGVCEELPTVDEDCVDIEDNAYCDFAESVWCDTFTMKCQAPAISPVNGPCNVMPVLGAGARRCAEGLFCLLDPSDEPVGTCTEPAYLGESCEPLMDTPAFPSTCHPLYQCNLDTLECEGDYAGECTGP